MRDQIVRDISQLYELSLSVGNSLNLQENCAEFLPTLMRGKNLAFAGLWLLEENGQQDAPTRYQLQYAHPRFRVTEASLDQDHPIFQRLGVESFFVCNDEEEDFRTYATEKDIKQGVVICWKLGQLGLLKLISFQDRPELKPEAWYKLKNVMEQFTVSVEGCLSHQRLIEEIAERKIIQQELIRSKEVEEQFFANMSHEIRTPINGMLGMMNLMLSSSLQPEQESYVRDMKQSSKHLLAILNDILDFSKIKQGKIDFELKKFDLMEQLRILHQSAKARGKEKQLRVQLSVDMDIPRYVVGDAVRLNQILNNLVGNALKFTQEGEVRVEVEMLEERTDEVKIQFLVSDTGIGIAPEQLTSIFDNFIQASKDTTRKFGGTGLGLSIVKQLVELMGGEIQVRSQLHQGSAFTICLPFQLASQEPLPVDEHPVSLAEDEPSLHGKHILIVEDILMNRKVVARMLAGWGGQTSIAKDGLEAVQICEEQAFDLILMDIQMPNLDGYDATRSIRKSSGPNASIPIIALTASTRARVREQVLEVGMNAYVLKPFEPKELYRIIQQHLQAVPKKEEVSMIVSAPPPTPVAPVAPIPPVVSEEPSEPDASEEEPGIQLKDTVDMSYLRTLGGGDEEFIKEMVQIFLDQTPGELESLETHISQEDWEQVKQGAHKLKYPFSSIGRKDLFTLLTKMEANALEGQDPTLAHQQIKQLRTASLTTFETLQNYFEPDSMQSHPYSCLIVDDEAMSRKALRRLIEQSPRLALAGVAENAEEARSILQKQPTEILFLDVEMPGMSGLELLATIQPMPKVVLVSSHTRYAVDAFEFEVTDYLVKPVTVDRFAKAVHRLTSQMARQQLQPTTHLLVRDKDRRTWLDARSILWIEALGDYMRIHTPQQRYVIHSTMKKLVEQLPDDQFIRIHRSYLIQRSAIKSIRSQHVELQTGKEIPIGKSYRKRVLADLLEKGPQERS